MYTFSAASFSLLTCSPRKISCVLYSNFFLLFFSIFSSVVFFYFHFLVTLNSFFFVSVLFLVCSELLLHHSRVKVSVRVFQQKQHSADTSLCFFQSSKTIINKIISSNIFHRIFSHSLAFSLLTFPTLSPLPFGSSTTHQLFPQCDFPCSLWSK